MKNPPAKVRLIGRKNNFYLIQFPNIPIPVEVNEELYRNMLESPEYKFVDSDGKSSVGKRYKKNKVYKIQNNKRSKMQSA
ncbi:hypothetical protein AWE51_25125 [Aquimarina aggregata]|uniref:Uncharacterized protein n=1 Tax=Aquimarina aggregata TaxID=1642818 RepID=A0A162CPE1_9FLAO|nr:hypothetical protein [Aquimarina aggregata]KZS40184.1 hypothetical protein AWE51_25125 [Aquimarina aggregata]